MEKKLSEIAYANELFRAHYELVSGSVERTYAEFEASDVARKFDECQERLRAIAPELKRVQDVLESLDPQSLRALSEALADGEWQRTETTRIKSAVQRPCGFVLTVVLSSTPPEELP